MCLDRALVVSIRRGGRFAADAPSCRIDAGGVGRRTRPGSAGFDSLFVLDSPLSARRDRPSSGRAGRHLREARGDGSDAARSWSAFAAAAASCSFCSRQLLAGLLELRGDSLHLPLRARSACRRPARAAAASCSTFAASKKLGRDRCRRGGGGLHRCGDLDGWRRRGDGGTDRREGAIATDACSRSRQELDDRHGRWHGLGVGRHGELSARPEAEQARRRRSR